MSIYTCTQQEEAKPFVIVDYSGTRSLHQLLVPKQGQL